MPQERLVIPNRSGIGLAAVLDRPTRTLLSGCAVIAHCFTCTKNLTAARHLSQALLDAGITTVRFDFTGLGDSEGDAGPTPFTANVSDVVDVGRYLAAQGLPPALLVGHSLGGTAALLAAKDLPSVRAVATIGAPADPTHVTQLFPDDLATIERLGKATVDIGGRPFTIDRPFVEDLARTDLKARLASFRASLLILHSPVDQVVGIDHAATLFDAVRHPKSFVSLDHADHLLSDPEDSRYAGGVIAAWAQRYLVPAPVAAAPATDAVVTRTGQEPYLTEVQAGPHRFDADEPVSVGGGDQGPTPYDLLAGALGACTGMTLRMYADRKGWPLTAVTVAVAHDRVHQTDCADCESLPLLDRFTRRIHLAGDLTSDQRDRLLAIADKCPVHRTLSHASTIVTAWAPAESPT
jgi:uncharacterized OsmC-like protein/pimeloyl-ACP methyl ester carboxylesterase